MDICKWFLLLDIANSSLASQTLLVPQRSGEKCPLVHKYLELSF